MSSIISKKHNPNIPLAPSSASSASTATVESAGLLRLPTPNDVLHLTKITDEYMCSPDANVYEIDFTRFKIRDLESGAVLFEIAKPSSEQQQSAAVAASAGVPATAPATAQTATLESSAETASAALSDNDEKKSTDSNNSGSNLNPTSSSTTPNNCETTGTDDNPLKVGPVPAVDSDDADEAITSSPAAVTTEEHIDPNAGRYVRYQFTPQFLKLKTVGAT